MSGAPVPVFSVWYTGRSSSDFFCSWFSAVALISAPLVGKFFFFPLSLSVGWPSEKVDNRCEECHYWSSEIVYQAQEIQYSQKDRRDNKAKTKIDTLPLLVTNSLIIFANDHVDLEKGDDADDINITASGNISNLHSRNLTGSRVEFYQGLHLSVTC